MFSSEAVCCTPGVAFPEGCGTVAPSPQPCWVVDTYSPSRLCRSTNTLCGKGGCGVHWTCRRRGAWAVCVCVCTRNGHVLCGVEGYAVHAASCHVADDTTSVLRLP